MTRALPPASERLTVLGWWFRPDAPSELPLPQRLVGGWDADARASTTPMRSNTTRAPACASGAVPASHARATSARKPWPGALASSSASSPRSP
ncbi:MAG: hypothetical protein ACK595_16470 [Planctomycetota bacterium]